MNVIQRYANEIEPGDIVYIEDTFMPVAMVSKDYQGAISLHLAIDFIECDGGDHVKTLQIDTWDFDIFIVGIPEE